MPTKVESYIDQYGRTAYRYVDSVTNKPITTNTLGSPAPQQQPAQTPAPVPPPVAQPTGQAPTTQAVTAPPATKPGVTPSTVVANNTYTPPPPPPPSGDLTFVPSPTNQQSQGNSSGGGGAIIPALASGAATAGAAALPGAVKGFLNPAPVNTGIHTPATGFVGGDTLNNGIQGGADTASLDAGGISAGGMVDSLNNTGSNISSFISDPGKAISNTVENFIANPVKALANIGLNIAAGAAGNFVGDKIGDAIGSNKLGGSYGSTAGGFIGSFGGPIGTFIGSTLGRIIGGFIGAPPTTGPVFNVAISNDPNQKANAQKFGNDVDFNKVGIIDNREDPGIRKGGDPKVSETLLGSGKDVGETTSQLVNAVLNRYGAQLTKNNDLNIMSRKGKFSVWNSNYSKTYDTLDQAINGAAGYMLAHGGITGVDEPTMGQINAAIEANDIGSLFPDIREGTAAIQTAADQENIDPDQAAEALAIKMASSGGFLQ